MGIEQTQVGRGPGCGLSRGACPAALSQGSGLLTAPRLGTSTSPPRRCAEGGSCLLARGGGPYGQSCRCAVDDSDRRRAGR